MKPTVLAWLFFAITHYATSQDVDQHPLVGTWEMISVKGVDANGNPFYMDTTSARETKIITPTHYMFIAWDVDGDSLVFNRTMTGKVTFRGDRYIETPSHASVQILDNVEVDFRWEVEGDIFTQSGKIVRPDGKEVVLEALKFRRVNNGTSHAQNPAIGTWRQTSGYLAQADGQQQPYFGNSHAATLIVTPTHWMRMDLENAAFKHATYGTYEMQGDSVLATVLFSTQPGSRNATLKLAQQVVGDTLKTVQNQSSQFGTPVSSYDTYKKIH